MTTPRDAVIHDLKLIRKGTGVSVGKLARCTAILGLPRVARHIQPGSDLKLVMDYLHARIKSLHPPGSRQDLALSQFGLSPIDNKSDLLTQRRRKWAGRLNTSISTIERLNEHDIQDLATTLMSTLVSEDIHIGDEARIIESGSYRLQQVEMFYLIDGDGIPIESRETRIIVPELHEMNSISIGVAYRPPRDDDGGEIDLHVEALDGGRVEATRMRGERYKLTEFTLEPPAQRELPHTLVIRKVVKAANGLAPAYVYAPPVPATNVEIKMRFQGRQPSTLVSFVGLPQLALVQDFTAQSLKSLDQATLVQIPASGSVALSVPSLAAETACGFLWVW